MTIDCHVDGRALSLFECDMLDDYAEQIEHGEELSLSEIIESQLEIETDEDIALELGEQVIDQWELAEMMQGIEEQQKQ